MPIRGDVWRSIERDPEEAARYLEVVTQLLDAAKRQSIDMLRLQPGDSVLDVGCGLGKDAEIILTEVDPTGRVTGIDTNRYLIAKASERTKEAFPRLKFHVGDALALDFPNDTFDACRADRVLQHLDDPVRAIMEMVRVTKPRGRISMMDIDWHTMIIAGGDIAVAQKVTQHQASFSAKQGDIGRRLMQLLMDAGCDDLEVDAKVTLYRNLGVANFVLRIRNTLEAAINSGSISPDAGETWWKAIHELNARKRFFASVNCVICAGVKSPQYATSRKKTDV
jgi:ubiquinone/menaquinone biosynthesis C-methylase UbiE